MEYSTEPTIIFFLIDSMSCDIAIHAAIQAHYLADKEGSFDFFLRKTGRQASKGERSNTCFAGVSKPKLFNYLKDKGREVFQSL